MVDYGTTKVLGDNSYADVDPTSVDDAGESSTLLGNASPQKQLRDGQATIVSCVSNLCNTIIGSGEYVQ